MKVEVKGRREEKKRAKGYLVINTVKIDEELRRSSYYCLAGPGLA